MSKKIDTEDREQLDSAEGHALAAEEFERLSYAANGDSKGWKFDREEIHGR